MFADAPSQDGTADDVRGFVFDVPMNSSLCDEQSNVFDHLTTVCNLWARVGRAACSLLRTMRQEKDFTHQSNALHVLGGKHCGCTYLQKWQCTSGSKACICYMGGALYGAAAYFHVSDKRSCAFAKSSHRIFHELQTEPLGFCQTRGDAMKHSWHPHAVLVLVVYASIWTVRHFTRASGRNTRNAPGASSRSCKRGTRPLHTLRGRRCAPRRPGSAGGCAA